MIVPAVDTSGLSCNFGKVTALSDLSLCIPQGVIYGLIGPNGAGKTTTIRLLLGLLRPTAGSVFVLGQNPIIAGDRVRRDCGVVLEPCGLYERLSASDNLDYIGRIWHMARDARESRARELLNAMGLWERRDEVIAGWGRGLKQRLCIARCLFHRPKLALMDEPYAGLDAEAVDEISCYLSKLTETTGITILMATNNLTVADTCCHRVTVLNQGLAIASGRTDLIRSYGAAPTIEIAGSGFTDEVITLLLRRPEVSAVDRINHHLSLQLAAQVDTSPLVSLLVESGASVTEVRKSKASLKSAFDALLYQETDRVQAP